MATDERICGRCGGVIRSSYTSSDSYPYVHVDVNDCLIAAKGGTTLRDYFAAAALAGMCANRAYDEVTLTEHAKDAYRLADAMLAERDK